MDADAGPDVELGEFLFRVHCRSDRSTGCVVGTVIVCGVVGTAILSWITFDHDEQWMASLIVLGGFASTFLLAFRLWRKERSVLRLYANGCQLVRGDLVDDEVLLDEVQHWSVRGRGLHLHVPPRGWLRLRFGPVGIEDVADYLEERLDPPAQSAPSRV